MSKLLHICTFISYYIHHIICYIYYICTYIYLYVHVYIFLFCPLPLHWNINFVCYVLYFSIFGDVTSI